MMDPSYILQFYSVRVAGRRFMSHCLHWLKPNIKLQADAQEQQERSACCCFFCVFFLCCISSPPQCSNWSFNPSFFFFFLVRINKTNCIFLEIEGVFVFTASAWLPGTVFLAVASSSQKLGSLALLSSTPATSGCCRLPQREINQVFRLSTIVTEQKEFMIIFFCKFPCLFFFFFSDVNVGPQLVPPQPICLELGQFYIFRKVFQWEFVTLS